MAVRELYSNSADTTLNGSINNSTTTVVATDASTFPTARFRLIVEDEIMWVVSRSSNTLTVIRGIEGTTAVSHSSGVVCNHILTAGTLDALKHDFLGDIGMIDTSVALSTDDDYFDDENYSGWTTVQTTPNATITERNHFLSVKLPGSQAGAQITGIVKAKTPSAGDWVQCGVRWGANVTNYPLYGLVMANGASYGSGHQLFFLFSQEEKLFYLSRWDGWNTNGGSSPSLSVENTSPSSCIHFRMLWESTDHYSGFLSPDGISWAKVFNNENLGSVGTPTHMGMMCSAWNNSYEAVSAFSYCRFSF